MKKGTLKAAALLLAGVMACAPLAGCSRKITDYSSEVAANCGDAVIYLDEVNLMARYNQWINEMYYMSYFGEGMWSQEYNGKTMEVSTKEEVMASLLQTEVLIAHAEEYGAALTEADEAKVDEACSEFFETADERLLEMSGATEELVKRVYTKNALANKVWKAITDDIDTEVSEEESQMVGVSYVLIGNDNEAIENPEETANGMVSRVQAGEELSAVAEEAGLYSTSGNYAKHEETEDVLASAAISMKAGDVQAVHDESTGWYVVYCDTENDEEATANKVEAILSERRDAKFKEVYASWEKPEFQVNEDIWDEIVFAGNPAYQAAPETTAEAETGTEGESAGESESGSTQAAETETGDTQETGNGAETGGETEEESTTSAGGETEGESTAEAESGEQTGN